MLGATFEELWLAACCVAALPFLYRSGRIHYFEQPAQERSFHDWVEQSYPDIWMRLPAWERRCLNPVFAVARIRREHLVVDPEFERRWQETRRLHLAAFRPGLIALALVLIGLAPALLRRLR